jgi:hypothetical protein
MGFFKYGIHIPQIIFFMLQGINVGMVAVKQGQFIKYNAISSSCHTLINIGLLYWAGVFDFLIAQR